MSTRTPASRYAWLVGIGLSLRGILGFFYTDSFGTGAGLPAQDVLGILAVNGWTNVLHVATGVLGLAAVGSARAARAYSLGVGSFYLAIAGWGFALGADGDLWGLIALNTADNVVHMLIGVLGIATAIASPPARSPGAPGARVPSPGAGPSAPA